MKTFKDLEFKPHKVGNGLHARMDFDNGYGISVMRFKLGAIDSVEKAIVRMFAESGEYGSYTSDETEWEVAVMKDGKVCCDTPITNDVLDHLKEDDVTKVMQQIQELPNPGA